MIAAELRGGNKPSLNEALGWIGSRVDDIYGTSIGRLEDVWIDPGTGAPRWLLVKEGRFGGRSTLVPFGDATAGAGHVWVPYEREVVRDAPQIEPGAPLTQQVESTLRNHYAANASAAVSQSTQPAARAAAQGFQAQRDSAGTHATVRLAATPPPTANPVPPSPLPPPRLPQRPPPPVAAPPAPGYQQAPPPQGPLQPPAPVQPPPYEAPRYQAPRYDYPPPPPVPPQQPAYTYQPPPAPAAYQYPQQPQYTPPPVPMPPPQQPTQDPFTALAGIPPGHYVEIELGGSLTISGELRQVRISPRDGNPEQSG